MMKPLRLLKTILLVAPLMLGACKSTKTMEGGQSALPVDSRQFLQKVAGNARTETYITSKIKFRVQMGSQDISLSGNLKMKRDNIIRLQLMALGLVEAGRMEFTPDYVLIMDRINKQYLKVPYEQLDFMRDSGINFYSLQALFWNELFMPGTKEVTAALDNYRLAAADNGITVAYDRGKMSYKWLADSNNATIKTANARYMGGNNTGPQLNWEYNNFKPMGKGQFPTANSITFDTGKKVVKVDFSLGSFGSDSGWEAPTEVSGKYKQVKVEDILRRLMSL